jgi:hypothetical protein
VTVYDVDALARDEWVRTGRFIGGTLYANAQTRRTALDRYAIDDDRFVPLNFKLTHLRTRWGELVVETDAALADGEMRVVFSAA